ncbi:unnamed protein product [Rotaria magnacalcarata]|uniref:Nuclear receptor domain-containing protein n=1 Tax=Rotaria magnacalcarata TaxID=392030 RepID=A0A820GPW1_9BILA|nr:unnamed protein product [Rotaria magnacalcarata]CAF4281183.1 unnamed protein product [Rotaria magnacalcarata]
MFSIQTKYDRSSIKQSYRIKGKPTNKRYRLLLTCVVCNGEAHGYNFDAISCESCKAFFRRNALRPPGKLQCSGNGHCDVRFNQNRRCKKCRLEECFKAGMRKEWILTEIEKQEKRMKIEQNRHLRQIHDHDQSYQQRQYKHDTDLSADVRNTPATIIDRACLADFDWLKIESIRNAYAEAVKLNQTAGILPYPCIQPIESTLELFRVPLYISSMRLISFFKQIPEFQQFDKDEQVYFVKLNTLSITFLHSMYIYGYEQDAYHEPGTTDPLFLGKDWLKTINREFHRQMKKIQNNFVLIEKFDENLIKLFFLIILFSNHLDLKHPITNINTLHLFKVQNIYNELFYKYCLYHYGFHKSSILLLQYTTNIMKIQNLIDDLKYTACSYMDLKLLTPVMRSLL